jgi:homoserine kinase type II
LTWTRAPAGFSGAKVWCGSDESPRIALKAWPGNVTRERLQQIHAWLALAAHVTFMPTVFAGAGGETTFAEAGCLWDCYEWKPGAPRMAPTAAEVEAACEAVARLHEVWAGSSQVGPCPGVENRLRILAENEPLLRAGPDSLPPVSPQLDPLLRRALLAAQRLAPQAVGALRQWASGQFTLQPCVRDLRADHVLFEGDRVAGIIDFGAMAVDSPAVDLARLLGDYAPASEPLFGAGLRAYRHARGAFDAPDEFVRHLADSGAVCSLLGWLVRLVARRESVFGPALIASRLARLVERAERISQS